MKQILSLALSLAVAGTLLGCDRGADNFDVFAHLHEKGDSWVIRAAQLTRKVRTTDGRVVKLGELMKSAPLQGTYQLYVSANRNQVARWAQVEVRATSVTLQRPREGSTAFVLDRNIREVPTNVVQVQEIDPPKNCTPLQWVLRQRILHAQHLLEATDLPVEIVASRCGFGSATALRVHFRRATGTTPQSYRRAFRTVAS